MDRPLQRRQVDRLRDADRGSRPLKPIEMFAQRERLAVIQPDDFINAVGELKAAVFDADSSIGEGEDASVDPDEVRHGRFRLQKPLLLLKSTSARGSLIIDHSQWFPPTQ